MDNIDYRVTMVVSAPPNALGRVADALDGFWKTADVARRAMNASHLQGRVTVYVDEEHAIKAGDGILASRVLRIERIEP